MNDHGPHNNGHYGGADQKGISIFQGCAWTEFKNEVVVDSSASPHIKVTPIHKNVQTKKSKHAAKKNRTHGLCTISVIYQNKLDFPFLRSFLYSKTDM